MGHCRGRRRCKRWITEMPAVRCFLPEGANAGDIFWVKLSVEELEALRLVDLMDLQQQEAALQAGVSRKAFWNDISSARKKVAMALSKGYGIIIEGGDYALKTPIKSPSQEGDVPVASIGADQETNAMASDVGVSQDSRKPPG